MKLKTFFKFFALTVFICHLSFLNFRTSLDGSSQSLNLDNIKRISRASYLIQNEYYNPERIQAIKMLKEGFYELAKEVPEILPKFSPNVLEFHLGVKKITISLKGIERFYQILYPVSQAFDFLKNQYKGEVKFEDMEYSFIAGMLSVLDPHSNILPPKVYEEFKTQTQGEYGGLGIVISLKDRELTVIAPIEGTPAYRAGIEPDDKILQIGDQSTTNMTLTEAVDLMRGRPNTQVTLKIKSKNRDPRDVTLTREVIVIESVQSKLLTHNKKSFGVIRVKGFQEDTYRDVKQSLKSLHKKSGKNLSGLILDLRNNPGGLLDQAIYIADMFLKAGEIVITTGATNMDEEVALAKSQAIDSDIPMIVLINQGSASASEIVAGALKNNNRAIVMGQVSFGKGSVQSLFNLRDGSSLKLTVAQYLTPGRESIQAVGISPDIHLYPSVIDEDFYDLKEDTAFGEEKLDAHLDNTEFVKKHKPTYTLTYLKEATKDNEPESSYVSQIKEKDFPLQLALKILDQTGDRARSTMLSNAQKVLSTQQKVQEQKIVKALKSKDIDWTKGPQNNTPGIQLSHKIFTEDNKETKNFLAGQKITLKLTAKNTTNTALHRVLTTIDSLNPLINNREFVFGKINPHKQKTTQVSITVPSEVISFTEDITLKTFTSSTQKTPDITTIATRFVEKSPPRFSYAYEIIDGQIKGTVGNKNGIPEKGESVAFKVSLKNLGPGDSEKTIINIKNNHGKYVFLKEARKQIGMLKNKQSTTANLLFDIKKDFSEEVFKLDVFAIDDVTKANINDTLKFSLTKTPKQPNLKPGDFQTSPAIQITKQKKTAKNQLLISGSVQNDTPLKDIAIFAKGRKIVYMNLQGSKPVTHKEFTTTIPLEDGINSIIIQARGHRNLSHQKTLSVVHRQPKTQVSQKKQ